MITPLIQQIMHVCQAFMQRLWHLFIGRFCKYTGLGCFCLLNLICTQPEDSCMTTGKDDTLWLVYCTNLTLFHGDLNTNKHDSLTHILNELEQFALLKLVCQKLKKI